MGQGRTWPEPRMHDTHSHAHSRGLQIAHYYNTFGQNAGTTFILGAPGELSRVQGPRHFETKLPNQAGPTHS